MPRWKRTLGVTLLLLAATSKRAHADEPVTSSTCASDLEQKYAASPDFTILYALAECHEQLGDPVRAAAALKHYLEQAGSAIGDDRRAEVTQRLAQLDPRVARITVSSNVRNIEVRVDGSCALDEATYEPLCTSSESSRTVIVNPGERRLTVKHTGFRDVEQVLVLAAGDNLRVRADSVSDVEPNPYRERMWTAWGVTGGAVVGATILGVRTAVTEGGIDSGTGIATIALGGIALVGAGVATYFTIRKANWTPTPAVARALDLAAMRVRF
jgi:hypothetical protein